MWQQSFTDSGRGDNFVRTISQSSEIGLYSSDSSNVVCESDGLVITHVSLTLQRQFCNKQLKDFKGVGRRKSRKTATNTGLVLVSPIDKGQLKTGQNR